MPLSLPSAMLNRIMTTTTATNLVANKAINAYYCVDIAIYNNISIGPAVSNITLF